MFDRPVEIVEVVDYVWSHSAKQGPNNTSVGCTSSSSFVQRFPFLEVINDPPPQYVDFGGLSAIASQVDVHPFFWDNFKHDFIPEWEWDFVLNADLRCWKNCCSPWILHSQHSTTSFDSGGFDGDEGTDEDALIAAVANHWVEFRSAFEGGALDNCLPVFTA